MDFSFFEPWHGFLPREGGHVVAFMGAGGKSTLLAACAAVLDEEGVPCITAKTVAGGAPLPGPRIDVVSWEQGEKRDLPAGAVLAHPGDEEALVDPAEIDALGDLLPDAVALVEVDVAAGLPLKSPAFAVPRFPARTSVAVVVMGSHAVGSPAGDVVAGFEPEAMADANLAAWSTWEWDHSLQLLTGEGGYLDQVPPGVPVVLALTGLDDQPDSIGLFGFVGDAMADSRVPIVLFSALEDGIPRIRAACREDDSPLEPPG